MAMHQNGRDAPEAKGAEVTRRAAMLTASGIAALSVFPAESQAIGFTKELKKRKIPPEEYTALDDNLKVYELVVGKGDAIKAGDAVVVHFDCYFRGIDVVSTRAARLLGGNRTVAEPLELIAGGELPRVGARKMDFDERAGGLYAAAGGPKPPPALPVALLGMKVGGKRSVLVPAELAYGAKGELEIPPNAAIELQIEVLEKRSK